MADPQAAGESVILGIHTNAPSNPSGWAVDTVGHAWLTITRNGQTNAYGLWPNDHPRFASEHTHPVSNVRTGIENDFKSTADRYYTLNPEQVKELNAAIGASATWGYTSNCASWATNTAEKVTNEHIKSHDNYGLTTPGDLFNGIHALENEHLTSLDSPRPHINASQFSSPGKDPAITAPNKTDQHKVQTGDPYMDKLLNNLNDPAAFKQSVTDLSNSAAGQAFRAEGQAMHQEHQNQQLQAQLAQQQTQIQTHAQTQSSPVMTR